MNGRYYAKKVQYEDSEFGALKFDSEMEFNYFLILRKRLDSGEIRELKIHPRYLLQPGFSDAAGREFQALNYEADFEYFDVRMGIRRVADVKGFEAPEFPIHRKLFEWSYCRGDGAAFPNGLEVLKYSKSTGWVDADQYKAARKSALAKAKAEKREAQEALERREREDSARRREIARIRALRAKASLTKAEKARLEFLMAKWGDYIL